MHPVTLNGSLVDAPCTILQHNFSVSSITMTSYYGSDKKPIDGNKTYKEEPLQVFAGMYCVAVWRCNPKKNTI